MILLTAPVPFFPFSRNPPVHLHPFFRSPFLCLLEKASSQELTPVLESPGVARSRTLPSQRSGRSDEERPGRLLRKSRRTSAQTTSSKAVGDTPSPTPTAPPAAVKAA